MTDLAYRLRLPGPTQVPARVRAASAQPMISHRGHEFHALMRDVQAMLGPVFGAAGPILLFAASGTGMMEAALANILGPGTRALIIANGQFGERFAAIAREFGGIVDTIAVPWGEAVDPALVEARLRQHDYRAVVAVHNESSTGVVTDLAALGRITRNSGTLLVADTVSGIGGIPFEQDAWGVDIVIAAAHKALMCPPGLGLASLSAKAWEVVAHDGGVPRFYWDFRRCRDAAAKDETPFTPPVSLVMALAEALRMMSDEGMAQVLARHRRCAAALRSGAAAIGLENFTRTTSLSDTVSVFAVPPGLEGGDIVRHLYERHRTVIAGARNRLAGKVIRFGTMGEIRNDDILTDLTQLEETLAALGHRFNRGAGTAAAAAVLGAP
ncbi:MAG TPA: alanine--glyoxylate aminotransferase family protein [Stellaceae bacterium]|nr:alanine--glyoxylate aminotransferase family protein [Stellaceae bacterium]